jgi:8-oxo-dGTP pyrophosphatase MutT (NUDIX family)
MLFTEKPASLAWYKDIVGCFVEYEGKILLLCRQQGKSEGGKYGLPAGKVDAWETLIDAMKREAFEETWLDIWTPEYRTVYYVHYPERKIVFHVFKTVLEEVPQITLRPVEHSWYEFCTPQESLKKPLMLFMPEIVSTLYLLS